MWLDHIPEQMQEKRKECGFNDPPHSWCNEKFTANKKPKVVADVHGDIQGPFRICQT